MTDSPRITKPQAEALATVVHGIRPDWGIPSLITLIGNNLNHQATYPELALAAVRCAAGRKPDGTPLARTPAVIYQPGRHWATDQPGNQNQPPGPPCQDHPEQEANTCRCCWADIKTGHRPAHLLGKHHETEQAS